MSKYFADLNPDYPSRYERRWAVFYRFDPAGPTVRAQPRYSLTFATRKAAERNAALLDRAEFDPLAEGEG
jgi:hypothetical protein